MTIVEVMISFVVFIMLAMGTLSAVLQSRKISEDNVAQATAAVVAQGIIEQVQLNPYADITDPTATNYPNLYFKFNGTDFNNLVNIQQDNVPWNLATFSDIGAHTIPTDPTSPILGVLIDVQYMAADGVTIIRPARYMKMQVIATRTIDSANNNVEVVLTYRWQPPSRNNPGIATPTWITRELRTIRSEASSY